jgi:activating signal cointegrator 1
MLCLSLHQPWASLLVAGRKRFLIKTWQTRKQPGTIAIHASNLMTPKGKLACTTEPIKSILAELGFTDWLALPRGKVIGTAELVEVTGASETLAKATDEQRQLSGLERGSPAWIFKDARALAEPFKVRGWQGLFQVEMEEAKREHHHQVARTRRRKAHRRNPLLLWSAHPGGNDRPRPGAAAGQRLRRRGRRP